MKSKMDESCWWSSSIPASKRASHVIIIGFLCVSLAAGLSDDGGLRTRREHADMRQNHHHNQQQLHTISATIRDAENSALLHNLLASKNSPHISTDSAAGHRSSSVSNNKINQITSSNITSSSSTTLSKLTASVLSRLNSSSGTNRTEQGERLLSWSPMNSDSSLQHHLRPSSQVDAAEAAAPSRRVRRKASSRGSTLIYNSKQPTQLFCRTNFRLAVHEDGTINGTRDNMDVYSSLYIQSQRRSIVSIKGLRSQLYVCVDESGNLYGSTTVSRNCYFQEKIEPNFFNTYAYKMPDSSSKRRRHRTLFLSINKYGESRIAKVRTQKKAQFIPLVPPEELL